MKWYNQKEYNVWDLKKRGLQGRKNNYKFEINDYTKGFSREHLGWYISIHDVKTDKDYNSLWDNIYFKDVEKAKQWCEEYAKENQNNRLKRKGDE